MFTLAMVHETLGTGLLGACLLAALFVAPATARAQDWTLYNALLTEHVAPAEREGVSFNAVDYAAWARDPRYPQVLVQVENFPLDTLQSTADKVAFYSNVYNLYAIRMVIDHLPLESIRDAGSLFSPVWKKPVGMLGGRMVTLDEITYPLIYGWMPLDDVLETLNTRPRHVHVVLTVRRCPPEIVALADTVTEMTLVKPAFKAGVPAQRGIED